jgi:hypothetical protein
MSADGFVVARGGIDDDYALRMVVGDVDQF